MFHSAVGLLSVSNALQIYNKFFKRQKFQFFCPSGGSKKAGLNGFSLVLNGIFPSVSFFLRYFALEKASEPFWTNIFNSLVLVK